MLLSPSLRQASWRGSCWAGHRPLPHVWESCSPPKPPPLWPLRSFRYSPPPSAPGVRIHRRWFLSISEVRVRWRCMFNSYGNEGGGCGIGLDCGIAPCWLLLRRYRVTSPLRGSCCELPKRGGVEPDAPKQASWRCNQISSCLAVDCCCWVGEGSWFWAHLRHMGWMVIR